MATATQLIDTFSSLEDEINGREPTPELLRDWAGQLADACGSLAVIVEGLQVHIERSERVAQ